MKCGFVFGAADTREAADEIGFVWWVEQHHVCSKRKKKDRYYVVDVLEKLP